MNKVSVYGKGLTKSYGKTEALKSVSFSVEKGEIFGFIGPDGAGKTTLFRLLTTLLLPDSGTASIEGLDVVKDYRRLRQILGYMPGRFSLYQDLSVEENLRFFAGIFKVSISDNYHLIADIYEQIAPFAKRRAGKLSGGMKQKLALSCALIHKPEVLILDEPTTGVDAVSRREFWEMLIRLKQSGITILVATPYMDEAMLCDRVALIQHGSIMATGSPADIIQTYPQKLFRIKSQNTLQLLRIMRKMPGLASAEMFGEYIHIGSSPNKMNESEIAAFLNQNNIRQFDLEPMEAGIEDCFMHLMKQQSSS